MKKLGIAFALLIALASCSKSKIETPQTPAIPDLSAPIILSAGIEANAQSKAAIDGTTFPINTNNVFRLTAYAGIEAPSDWTSPYFADQQVNSAASSLIALNTAQYYPADGNKKLYFYAYAPAARSMTAETSSTAPIANYSITGKEDIMAAQVTSGIAKVSNGTQTQPELSFEHKLKQVKFIVKQDASFESNINVTSIKVMDQKTSAKLDVATGVLTFEATTDNITAYADATGIEITAK